MSTYTAFTSEQIEKESNDERARIPNGDGGNGIASPGDRPRDAEARSGKITIEDSVAPVQGQHIERGGSSGDGGGTVPEQAVAKCELAHVVVGGLATALASAPKRRTPTAEQAAIIEAAKAGHRVVVVQAGAGTGKTSTDKMIAEELGGRGQYTAFNAPLCAEAKAKMPSHVAVNTIHSLAFRAVGHKYKKRLNTGRVKAEETAKMLGLGTIECNGKRLAPGFLAGLVLGAIRRFCNSADAEVEAKHFAYQEGLDMPGEGGKRTWENNNRVREHLLPFAIKAWADLSDVNGRLPFTHDVYAKIWELGNPTIAADYLLVDESQDLVPRDLAIIRKQKCQVILVGDSNQTIYAWRGCEDALAEFPEAPTLFLSQSFRFGPAIADVANSVLATLEESTALRLKGLPSIESKVITHETDPTNSSIMSDKPMVLCDLLPSTKDEDGKAVSGCSGEVRCNGANQENPSGQARQTILCRTNAAAVAHLLGAMTEMKSCPACAGTCAVVTFSKSLSPGGGSGAAGEKAESARTSWGSATLPARCLGCGGSGLVNKRPFLVGGGKDVITFVEAAKQLKEGRGTSHPELACFGSWGEVEEYSKLEEGSDLLLMVKLIHKFGCEPILRALRSMPQERDADLIISTAHKSKGREWDRVKLASDFPVLSKCGDAEKKLLYVAVTRAKLVLDVSGCPFFTGRDALDVSTKKGVDDEREQGEREKGTNAARPFVLQDNGRKYLNAHHDARKLGAISSSSGTQATIGSSVPAGYREATRPQAGQSVPGSQFGEREGAQDQDSGKAGEETHHSSFTWSKKNGCWLIRGAKGQSGVVTVTRKSGDTSRERLGRVVWENGEIALYEVANR